MKRQKLMAALAGAGLLALTGNVTAHHSYAMFDADNPIELVGVVQEFKFTSPHSFIMFKVKQQDGSVTTWSLEGLSASALVRDGWSSKVINVGDELRLTISPLRSGAPGGAWSPSKVNFPDGRPLVIAP
jgi:Family of unknown function (DUF6152)